MSSSRFFTLAAGISGFVAIGLGAYGAHGVKYADDSYREAFKVTKVLKH
jgi:uncharacterized membrane protein YgdD (TMEM256/DUF423 family)